MRPATSRRCTSPRTRGCSTSRRTDSRRNSRRLGGRPNLRWPAYDRPSRAVSARRSPERALPADDRRRLVSKPKWHDRARELFEDPDGDLDRGRGRKPKTTRPARSSTNTNVRGSTPSRTARCAAPRWSSTSPTGSTATSETAASRSGAQLLRQTERLPRSRVQRLVAGRRVRVYQRRCHAPGESSDHRPYTLASWSFNEAYEDDAALAIALADLVNDEIQQLVDAGARYIQIDEAALATTPRTTPSSASV